MKARAAEEARVIARAEAKPALARAEILDKGTRSRLEAELEAAIKRRPTNERRLAGVLRALAPLSPSLRVAMAEATDIFLRRSTLDRDLYGACIRSLGECRDKSASSLLKRALSLDSAGGAAALSAACFSTDPSLGPLLAKVAAGQKAHIAFAAETARVVRGEANGRHLAALAPMIKESHRLTLCAEIFVPLAREVPAPHNLVNVGPALAVLRGAERHLGRWLVLAEVAACSGDRSPLDEALDRADAGASTARSAWSLVAWALDTRMRAPASGGHGANGSASRGAESSDGGDRTRRRVPLPTVRPTVEIVSRLSDRPSADRDATFLFRMARARMPSVRPMLETFAKELPITSEVGVRAASFLARDHGRGDLAKALLEIASSERKEELRGVATAALSELPDPVMIGEARRLSGELLGSRSLTNVAWGVLVKAAVARGLPQPATQERGSQERGSRDPHAEGVASETAVRWVQWGWLE